MATFSTNFIRLSTGLALGVFVLSSTDASAGVRCKMHVGPGCGGAIVYEIQLCTVPSLHQAKCRDLCEGLRPVCNISDFDSWFAAYYADGFLSSEYGIHGFKFDLADPAVSENYDMNGQLAATSGKSYTVCISTKQVPGANWSDESTVHAPARVCPVAVVPSAETCKGGTVFNNDPANPRCVTRDSTSSGDGSIGNFVSTINGGNMLVSAQNQHFAEVPSTDTNLNLDSIKADTSPAGFASDTATGGMDVSAVLSSFKPANSSGSAGRGSSSGSGQGSAGASGGTTSAVTAENGVNADQVFASAGLKSKEGYGAAGGGNAGSSGQGGASWFSGSGSASGAAVAGAASGEVGFGKDSGAGRGLASAGEYLNIEDPANYFMMTDIGISLFKRVTAQCRRKEKEFLLPAASGI